MHKKDEVKQLKLKLSYSPFTWYFNLRERIKKSFLLFEMNKFSNDISPWLQISYISSIFLVLCYYIFFKYYLLPSYIPIFKIYTKLSDRLLGKDLLFLILGVEILMNIIIIRFAYLLYDKDRAFTTILLLINTVINTFILIFILNSFLQYLYV